MKFTGAFTLSFALLCWLVAGCSSGGVPPANPPTQVPGTTFSSFDQPVAGHDEQRFGANEINFKGARVHEFLTLYQEVSGRTVVCASNLPAASITVRNQSPASRTEVLQLFDTTLAQQGVAMILSGDQTVKAVPVAVAAREAGPVIDLPADKLPDSASYMVRFVRLKKYKPSEVVPRIQAFQGIPNGILVLEQDQLLVLRDFSANIRQMLKVIEEIEPRASAAR